MLPTRPPPSSGELLTLTAVALLLPVMVNLATRNCPPETSCQPAGTCQSGLPSLETGAEAVGAPMPVSPMGGCDGGNSVCAWTVVNSTDLRNATNAGLDRKATRLNSSHLGISYAVFC